MILQNFGRLVHVQITQEQVVSMLQFLRKYQSYIFVVVTTVIVISFSFFGTYKAMPGNAYHEQTAFTAVDGTNVTRHELDEMANFLATDSEDKRLLGGAWGPNFLNDGVIKNDFLDTGLAEALIAAYPDLVKGDLQLRLEKEKRYSLYTHPQAKFVSVQGAWSYFAPQMKTHYDALLNSGNAVSSNSIQARVALFLDERRFPAPLLRQVLRYQQKQAAWIQPDPALDRSDLSLFGYHTVEDWFGPRFTRLVSEFLINGSKLAQQKGYTVTRTEALADLKRLSESSYQQNIQNPYLGVANSQQYFEEQLRRLGMDSNRAAMVWQQVLLFRRYFNDVGSAVITDPLMSQQFIAFTKETANGEIYHLPPELRFSDYNSLQNLEVYLDAVSKRSSDSAQSDTARLALPASFLSLKEVKAKAPELVQKRYELKVAHVQKSSLNPKVSLKEMWAWEGQASNWDRLKQEFPELGVQKGSTPEERLAALDALDDFTRMRIDRVARQAIVDEHPEWLTQALENAPMVQQVVGLSTKGTKFFVKGLDKPTDLIQLLDKAPLVAADAVSVDVNGELASYSADNANYYRIAVVARAPKEEILTFAEANREGILDVLRDRILEEHYQKIRANHATSFQRDDKSWKPLAEVRNQVADSYFESLLASIRRDYASANPKGLQPTTGDLAAAARFYAYGRALRAQLQKGGSESQAWVREEKAEVPATTALTEREPLQAQWKWIKSTYKTDRGSETDQLDKAELFGLEPGQWTEVHAPVNGDLYFAQLSSKANESDNALVAEKVMALQKLLSNEAQRVLMQDVLEVIKAKQAISLDYLDRFSETVELQPNESSDV